MVFHFIKVNYNDHPTKVHNFWPAINGCASSADELLYHGIATRWPDDDDDKYHAGSEGGLSEGAGTSIPRVH